MLLQLALFSIRFLSAPTLVHMHSYFLPFTIHCPACLPACVCLYLPLCPDHLSSTSDLPPMLAEWPYHGRPHCHYCPPLH